MGADDCFMHPSTYLESQFWLVCVFGSGVAVASTTANLLVLYILLTRKYFWRKVHGPSTTRPTSLLCPTFRPWPVLCRSRLSVDR